MKFIFTCDELSSQIMLEEFEQKDPNFKMLKWLNGGIGLAETNGNSKEYAHFIYNKPIIFVRHICKVDLVLTYYSNWKYKVISLAKNKLDKTKSFSIQLRHNTNLDLDTNQILTELSTKICEQGFTLDVKNCEQVVSIFIDNQDIYCGVDSVENNLSKFKGGIPHYAENEDFVCRAEFKMMEALDVFKINTSNLKTGVDFGSAPGGWTKVLAENGINMVAIDPAEMNNKVLALDNVEHKKMTIQEYFFHYNDKKFDIIVNDMKMDVQKSIQLTSQFYDKLNPNGIIIMTFKLPKNYTLELINKNIEFLQKKFKLITARQLFYNRSEITVLAKSYC